MVVEIPDGVGVTDTRVPESSLEVPVIHWNTHNYKHTPLANTLLNDVHM